MVPFREPEQDLVLHRRLEIHPKIRFPVHRRPIESSTLSFDRPRLLRVLLVPLVEPINGGVPNRAGPIPIQEDPEGEVDVVVANPLVLVSVLQLHREGDGIVGRGIQGFVEGRNVKGQDVAFGLGGSQA